MRERETCFKKQVKDGLLVPTLTKEEDSTLMSALKEGKESTLMLTLRERKFSADLSVDTSETGNLVAGLRELDIMGAGNVGFVVLLCRFWEILMFLSGTVM